MNTIDISKLNKAEVLAVLYNNSRPLGLGFLHYTPEDMSVSEAEELLKQSPSFDYLKGRVMKITISDEFDPWLYDENNGKGAAQRALQPLFDKI